MFLITFMFSLVRVFSLKTFEIRIRMSIYDIVCAITNIVFVTKQLFLHHSLLELIYLRAVIDRMCSN